MSLGFWGLVGLAFLVWFNVAVSPRGSTRGGMRSHGEPADIDTTILTMAMVATAVRQAGCPNSEISSAVDGEGEGR